MSQYGGKGVGKFPGVSVPLRGLYPYKYGDNLLIEDYNPLLRELVSVPLRGLYPYK